MVILGKKFKPDLPENPGKFQPGLPRKPGNIRLTNHFCLGFFGRNLNYQTSMENNYNQANLKSLVKPVLTRLNWQKPNKSGSTRVYQAH